MTDTFDDLVALRPDVPDETGWANSPAGRDVLARVHAAPPRRSWWRRRRFVVPTVVIGFGAAVAAGVAFAPADREPVAHIAVVCEGRTSDGSQSLTAIAATSQSGHAVIVAQCNAELAAEGKPAPVDWALCVVSVHRGQIGGAEIAVPVTVRVDAANAATVCQEAGHEPLR